MRRVVSSIAVRASRTNSGSASRTRRAALAWALALGVSLGVMIGRVRWLERTLNPFIVGTQVMPKVALVPLFVVEALRLTAHGLAEEIEDGYRRGRRGPGSEAPSRDAADPGREDDDSARR